MSFQTLSGTLNLGMAHLALAGQPDTDITFGTSSRQDQFAQSGSVRSYANGSNRVIAGGGTNRNETLTIMALEADDLNKLYSFTGKTCLFRDTYGRKLYVSFLGWSAVDVPLSSPTLTNVTLTLNVVSYTEVV